MKRIALIASFFIVLSGCYYLLTMRKSAEAIIEISPYGKMGGSHKGSSSSRMTRSYFQTQFSIVKNEKIVSRAIDDYRLDILFETDKATLLDKIMANINTGEQKGTDLIFIKAFSDTEEKAQQICYAIVHTYDELRREGIENTRNEVIANYKQKIEAQEDKVEDNRRKLHEISNELGIPYRGISYPEQHTTQTELEYDNAKRDRDILEILVKDIKDLDGKQLITRILTTNRPVTNLLRKQDSKLNYLIQTRDDLLANGLGTSHPRVQAMNTAINSTADHLAESITQTRHKLQNDLDLMNKKLKQLKKETAYQANKQSLSVKQHKQFIKVKDEYEREFKILQSIKSSEFRETIVSRLEIDPVQISEPGWTPEIEKMMTERKIRNE